MFEDTLKLIKLKLSIKLHPNRTDCLVDNFFDKIEEEVIADCEREKE